MFHKSVLLLTGLLKLIETSVTTGSVGVEFVGMVIFVETNLHLQCDHLPAGHSTWVMRLNAIWSLGRMKRTVHYYLLGYSMVRILASLASINE